MNAKDEFFAREAQVDAAAIAPLPRSRKIYVQGSRDDLRVPMREIEQSDTPASFGAESESRRSSSTTRRARTPIRRRRSTSAAACRPCAQPWIDERDDTVALEGPTSAYGRERLADARSTACASTCTASRAAREPARTSRRCITRDAASSRRRWSSSRSARTCSARRCSRDCRRRSRDSIPARASGPRSPTASRPSSCATRSRAAARSSRATSTIRNPSR